jgi:hypothetical protein
MIIKSEFDIVGRRLFENSELLLTIAVVRHTAAYLLGYYVAVCCKSVAEGINIIGHSVDQSKKQKMIMKGHLHDCYM